MLHCEFHLPFPGDINYDLFVVDRGRCTSLWAEKFTITEFLARLTKQYWKKSFGVGLQIAQWTLLATFILVVIGTIAECQPFPHYWQVVPDPGPRCRQGYVQLLTMGVCNVVTDLLLVFFPIPIILRSHMTVKRLVLFIDHSGSYRKLGS